MKRSWKRTQGSKFDSLNSHLACKTQDCSHLRDPITRDSSVNNLIMSRVNSSRRPDRQKIRWWNAYGCIFAVCPAVENNGVVRQFLGRAVGKIHLYFNYLMWLSVKCNLFWSKSRKSFNHKSWQLHAQRCTDSRKWNVWVSFFFIVGLKVLKLKFKFWQRSIKNE